MQSDKPSCAKSVWAEVNGEALSGQYPTSAWSRGEIVRDERVLTPGVIPAGVYTVEVGWFGYWSLDALPVTVDGADAANRVDVAGRVTVRPQQRIAPSDIAPEGRSDAVLAGAIALLGWDLTAGERSGDWMTVTLYWQVISPVARDYTVFVHLLGPDGRIVTQHDGQPVDGRYPTSVWRSGEVVADSHLLDTAGLLRGEYRLEVGLYDLRTMSRAAVVVGGVADPEQRVLLRISIPRTP